MELISIIIPMHNSEKFIRKTIENIKNQTYKNFELILVDDFSEDNTLKEIQKCIDGINVKLIKLNKNLGPAIARNKGLEIATGRYICFQDSDDLWELDKLEKQLNFMKEKDIAFSYTSFKYMSIDEKSKSRVVHVPKTLDYKKSLKNLKILTISVMFDLAKIEKKNLVMPNVPSEDVITWWNILEKGYLAYGLDEALVYYRVGSKNSLTSNKLKSAKNRWNLYRKVKKFSIIRSIYYFVNYAINATIKRI